MILPFERFSDEFSAANIDLTKEYFLLPRAGDGQINATNYLAGGVPFGPIISANITPDANGKPAGLDFEEYLELIRTGHDPDDPDEILQVMPWPIFRNMTDHDILAIYTYLSSIPHAEPGACTGPGQ